MAARVVSTPPVTDAAATPSSAPLALLVALAPALLMHHVEGVLLAKERLQQPVIPQPVAVETPPRTSRWQSLPAPASSMQVVPGSQAALHSQLVPDKGDGPAACMADDGALLGLAFLLRVLGQTAAFDRLRWFAAVQEHYAAQRDAIAAAARPAAAQHVGAHQAALAIARVERYAEEYALVEHALMLAHVVVDC